MYPGEHIQEASPNVLLVSVPVTDEGVDPLFVRLASRLFGEAEKQRNENVRFAMCPVTQWGTHPDRTVLHHEVR